MTIIDCAVYEDGRRRGGSLKLEDAFEAARGGGFVWLGLLEPSEAEFEAVRKEFNLHELAVEDAIKAHQRPKIEVYGDSLLVVLKPAVYDHTQHVIDFGEILIFVGERFLITVRHGSTALHSVRQELENRPDVLRKGPAAALYAIMDRVVDDYFPVVDGLDGDIREVEAEVFSESRSNPSEHIYRLKREVLDLDAAVSPLPEEMDRLARGQHPHIQGDILPYFRDVHDHLLRLVNQVDNYRELLTNVLTANLTQITVRQNDDMRRISAWAAMVAVPTMIAGIYGMNFEHMPELGWTYAYPAVLIAMALICFGLYRYFRKIGWL